MAIVDINWNPGHRQLKQFAVLWIAFFGAIGAYLFWIGGSLSAVEIMWGIGVLGVAGYFRPGLMRPVYLVWMALAMPIGWSISHLLLLAVYYLLLTPVGLLMRLFKYDPLERRIDRLAKSYWVPHDPATEPSRYFKQY